MQKTAFLLMIITILSKILGFGRELVMANFYGTGDVANAFIVAFTIPTVLFNFIGVGVTTGYIPMLSRIEKEQGIDSGHRFTSNLLNLLMLIAVVICALGIIFAQPLVKLFAWGFTGEVLALATYFTRFMMVAVFGAALSAVFRGYLNYKDNFIVPASTGFIMNIFTISAIVLSATQKNLLFLAAGAGFAQLVQYVFFAPSVKKAGYVHSKYLNWKDPHVKYLVMLALPIIVGVAVADINTMIDRLLASLIAEKGIAVLTYANRLLGFVSGIVIVSISTAIFPTLSRMAEARKIRDMKRTFCQSISLMNLLVLPSMVGFMLFAEPIVDLLFVRGQFTTQDGVMVASALFFYAPSLIGIAYRDILSRMFFAMHDTRTPAVNAVIMVILNVFFSILLSRFIGLDGLALGTSIATIIGSFILMQVLRVRLRGLTLSTIFKSSVKILICTAIMGVASYLFYRYSQSLFSSDTIRLFAAILVAVATYGVAVLVLRVEEAHQFIDLLARKLKRA